MKQLSKMMKMAAPVAGLINPIAGVAFGLGGSLAEMAEEQDPVDKNLKTVKPAAPQQPKALATPGEQTGQLGTGDLLRKAAGSGTQASETQISSTIGAEMESMRNPNNTLSPAQTIGMQTPIYNPAKSAYENLVGSAPIWQAPAMQGPGTGPMQLNPQELSSAEGRNPTPEDIQFGIESQKPKSQLNDFTPSVGKDPNAKLDMSNNINTQKPGQDPISGYKDWTNALHAGSQILNLGTGIFSATRKYQPTPEPERVSLDRVNLRTDAQKANLDANRQRSVASSLYQLNNKGLTGSQSPHIFANEMNQSLQDAAYIEGEINKENMANAEIANQEEAMNTQIGNQFALYDDQSRRAFMNQKQQFLTNTIYNIPEIEKGRMQDNLALDKFAYMTESDEYSAEWADAINKMDPSVINPATGRPMTLGEYRRNRMKQNPLFR